MKYTFKQNLFVTEAGVPMLFYIDRCAKKDQIASYIQHGGGWIVDTPSGPHTVHLVDDDYTPCDGEDVFSSNFILTSCKRNMLPKLGPFRRGKDNILNKDFDFNRILEMKTTWSEAKKQYASVRSEVTSSQAEVISTSTAFRVQPLNHSSQTLHIFNNSIPVVMCQKLPDNPIQDETTSSRQLRHDESSSASDSTLESISEKVVHPAKRHDESCSASDSTLESISEKVALPGKRKAYYREPFSDSERIEIVEYIVKNRKYSQLGGVEVWKRMERQKLCRGRTWQSMKEHYRKRILPRINGYHLPAHIVESFRKRTECKAKTHTANADRSLTLSETSKEVKSVEKRRAILDLEASTSQPPVKRRKRKLFNPCATPESSAAHTPQSVHIVKPHGLDHDIKRSDQLYRRQLLKQLKAAKVKSTSAINEPLCKAVTSTSNATDNPRQIACLLDSEKERHESLLNAPDLTPTLTLHNPGTSSTSHHKPDCHRKSHSPSTERPASPFLSFTPKECVKGDAPETDSEIIPSVLKPVNSSSQVMELESEIREWFQCTPEEIFMEEVVSNSGDESDKVDESLQFQSSPEKIVMEELECNSGDDCGETVGPFQGEINCSDKEDASLYEVENEDAPCKDNSEKDSSLGSRMEEACFQDLNEWSDDGLYWRGNVFPLKAYSKVVSSTSEIGETSMEAVHHVGSTSNKCNPKNRVSPSSDVDSEAETWKCYVKEVRRHRQRESLCCRKKSGWRPRVQHWLESTPKGRRVPHAHHEKVTEQKMTSDEDHNERERALMHADATEQDNLYAEDHNVRERALMHDDASEQEKSCAEDHNVRERALMHADATEQENSCAEDHNVTERALMHAGASEQENSCAEDHNVRERALMHAGASEQENSCAEDHNVRERALMHAGASEQENSCAEDHNVRERALMHDVTTQQKNSRAERRKARENALLLNPEVSYSRFNFMADLTDLSELCELEEDHPRNSPKGESNMLKKLNSPKLTSDRSVQTDPIKICDPEVCGRVSNSLILTSQTKEMCTSSEDPLLTSLRISPIKGPTSTVPDNSVIVISPVTPDVYERLSPMKTRSSPRGVRSPLSPRYLPL